MIPNIDLEKIVEAMKDPNSGVEVKKKTNWFNTYNDCFVATDAIEWLMKACEARTREEAVEKGQEMVQRFMISHTTGEHTFKDDKLYFYFVPQHLSQVALEMLDWENGVSIQTRQYKYWSYTSCFIGSEALSWLRNRYNLNFNDALDLGRNLIKYNLIKHVVGKHDFKDEYLFYTFPVLKLHGHPDAPPTSMADIRKGRLAPPHPTPNCVSTQVDPNDNVHLAKDGPINIPQGMTPEQVKYTLKSIMCDFNSALQNEHDLYLHYIVRVGNIKEFIDDLEFIIHPEAMLVHYRSASRVGYGDMGVNQKRVTKIYDMWEMKIAEGK